MNYKAYKISELIDEIAMGPFGSNIKVESFVDDGVPVLNGSNLEGFQLGEKSFRYVTEEKASSLGRANAHRGDIIITHRGTLGQIVYIPQTSKYDRYIISQSQFRIKCNEKVLPEYLVYYFHTPIGQHKLLSNASQVGVPALARPSSTFQKIEVEIPDLDIQRRVVNIINSLQNKIVLNNKINDNLEQQVMALFHQIFDESNSNRKHISANEYFDISIGKTPPRKESRWFSKNPSDCVWVSISDMGSCGLYIADSSEYITHEAVEKFNVKIVPDNTVILSFKLTVGRIAITDGCMTTNEAIAHFKTDEPRINEYLYCYLKNFNFQTMGSTSSIATAVNSRIIKGMSFIVPTDDELEKFHKIAGPLFMMIKSNQRENKYLGKLRDVLLPKLMSGEIDVEDIDV